jgi:predicted RNA binding protein YcfA (HicA-like mRNA interferase family)
MKTMNGKELAKLLEQNGWELARINGSHHIYIKQDRIERISIPIHGNEGLKIGLLTHLLKIADIEIK